MGSEAQIYAILLLFLLSLASRLVLFVCNHPMKTATVHK